ncbi:MAG: hypothetical protein ABIO55_16060, partial [Ginsengibacter sp.]
MDSGRDSLAKINLLLLQLLSPYKRNSVRCRLTVVSKLDYLIFYSINDWRKYYFGGVMPENFSKL